MKKRIAFFIGSMQGGGAERVISILANHYNKLGWEVDVILLLDATKIGYKLHENINVIDMSEGRGSYYQRMPIWVRKIRKYVKTSKPDRIISFVGRINVLVIASCLFLNVTIIVSERNDPKNDGRSKFMLSLCNFCYRKAKAVVYQTTYEQSCFSEKLNNGHIIGNPVSVNAKKMPVCRPFEVVTAGRLLPQKNQIMLIKAILMLKNKFPELHLKIYGEGALRQELQKSIEDLELEQYVELCGNVSDLHERINGAGMFVLCSEYEGLSNALIEAMMLGLPCISTDYPGIEELIENGVNGIIIPRGNVQRLAEAIESILKNQDLRHKLSSNAQKYAEKFEYSNVISQWEAVIN